MLSKDFAARPSAEEIARKLGESLLPSEGQERAAPWRQRRIWLAALAGFLFVAGLTGWFMFARRDSPQFENLRIQPLTSQGGWEGSPALSPDGQSVAFTWTERLDGLRQIYIKRLNDEEPVKLTHSESQGNIGSLVWSPDGNQIAFERWYGKSGAICSIASAGGNEKKVVDLMNASLSSAIDRSGDGTQLAFSEAPTGSNRLAIYLFNLRTGEKRKLTSPPPEDWGGWDPKFRRTAQLWPSRGSPVSGTTTSTLYRPQEGGPRRLTASRRGIWGHA